jgi:hypothetical protein
MAVILSVVEGWTGVLGPFTLLLDGVASSLTGFTIVPILRRPDGTLVTTGGTVTLLNQSTDPGEITYTPVASDFVYQTGGTVYSTYSLHWKVTDGAGKIVFFPNDAAAEIAVYRA